jgi:ATP-binding cassette subfamily F protein 3
MAPHLQINNLSKEYGGRTIFSGLSFSVFPKQKIGIIGRNGAGKSTIFRIILGQEKADSGEIYISAETRIGYVEQESSFDGTESALTYLLRHSGREEWRCRQLASRFLFDKNILDQAAVSLSGGWQMRLRLVAMLLQEPNLFLLDEPTNYLDLGTMLLLENFLRDYKGGFLIISHDRQFLKNVCRETMEITARRCICFPHPLEAYLAYKEQRAAGEAKVNQKIERQQQHMQDFVDRFRYKASKAGQAQAFVKKIEKLEQHRISIEHNAGSVRISIPPVEKRKGRVLAVDDMSIGYWNKTLASGFDFEVKGGEKLIVTGDNGQGKSTFIKTIAGQIDPVSGRYRWLTGLKVGYYEQLAAASLNPEERVGDYLNRISDSSLKTEKVLQMAGDFLFSGDDLKKGIGVLSGGEKSRLIIAGILLAKPDILILDEPTNHLDFETVEALGQALSEFAGAVIFSSHDRTFASLLAEKILEIRDGRAYIRYHDYENYLEKLEKRLKEAEEKEASVESKQPIVNLRLEEREKEKRRRLLERRIEKLEIRKNEILEYFLVHPTDYEEDKRQELLEAEEELKRLEWEWLETI